MKILALDIGAGTEDVLLYDSEKNIENCIKMVLPSPSQIFAAKVRQATHLCHDLFIAGDTIGGGLLSSALRTHVAMGCRVVMTEKAAYTVRNNLDEVREDGIEITNTYNPEAFTGKTLILQEVNLMKLQTFLTGFSEDLSDVDVVSIAVQDHGLPPQGVSNRHFRIQKMRDLLKSNHMPERLAFWKEELPSSFLRMNSAVEASQRQLPKAKVLIMDTAPAAILGCLTDLTSGNDPSLVINVGNGHTMAAILKGGRIIGLLEHHTRALNPRSIEQLIVDFTNGVLTDDVVFEAGGHGVFLIEEPPGFSNLKTILVTGPNRNLFTQINLKIHFAAPAGDVMMTGPMGLIAATKKKLRMG